MQCSDFHAEFGWNIRHHPPYSPDIAAVRLILVPFIKKFFSRQTIRLANYGKKDFEKMRLLERWNKFRIDQNGSYTILLQ